MASGKRKLSLAATAATVDSPGVLGSAAIFFIFRDMLPPWASLHLAAIKTKVVILKIAQQAASGLPTMNTIFSTTKFASYPLRSLTHQAPQNRMVKSMKIRCYYRKTWASSPALICYLMNPSILENQNSKIQQSKRLPMHSNRGAFQLRNKCLGRKRHAH